MIVVLCGEGPLKTGLMEHLLEKSFYLRSGQEFDGLEPDKNYVVDAPASLSGLQPWRERRSLIVWVGRNGQAPGNGERIIVDDTS